MLQPQVTFLVTLWGALLRTTEAVNSSTLPSPRDDLAMDQVVESSVKLQHLEGSGMEPTMDSSSALTTLAHIDTLFGNKYNGVLGPQFFSPFNIAAPRFPPNAVIGLSRPLQRGNVPPRDGRLMNLTQPSMSKEPIRLLQYIGTPESNNFKFVWVLARNLDTATAVSMKQPSNLCSPRLAPAVFQDDGYEFLGEADIDNRMMQYVFQGHYNAKSQYSSSTVNEKQKQVNSSISDAICLRLYSYKAFKVKKSAHAEEYAMNAIVTPA
ncbi:unnamed protein product [Nippostrongylus brasiliensis]|uniref:Secreted protein n=1 Tax=Nippostrongylus brasiliensis TaxID=27835 RepID=A0A158QZ61_NIPBR|nr:unnamed protein product [Nippostrongylus brasiliensis]